MKRLALMLILFSAIGALAFLSFHGLMGAEVQNQSKNVQRLRREWQRLAVKAGKEVDPECCVVDPCTYCLLNKEDGLCTCADDLNLGKEVCPECLGKWLNRRGSTHSWPGFRRVYPDLASWLIAQGGPPALCPMVSGRGGPMGMMSGQGGPIGMMRMPFGRQRRGTSDWLKEKQIDLLMKARELKLLSDYNCCMTGGGSCTYCIQDPQSTAATICDCKDKLKDGREVCPECFGVWASGEWNPELEKAFQWVYPSISRLMPKGAES